MNRKGFTLIELLAVIIILGVIMLIAIPSVTRYINESRKDTYIDTARQIVKGAIPMVNSGELDVYDTNTTYYIPASCIPTENAMSSPFGEFKEAYVIVGYTGEGYVYYWASVDSAHQGIEMKKYNKLTKNDVQPNMESVDTTQGIGSRTDIKILDEDECQSFIEGSSSGNNGVVYPVGKTKEEVVLGDIVKIADEEFYVVKHDGNDLILFARYNLKVGHKYETSQMVGGGTKVTFIGDYNNNDSGYCRQNEEVKGEISTKEQYRLGTTEFSETKYWEDDETKYRFYVYNSNSKIYPYLQEYKAYLLSKYQGVKDVRLLDINEYSIISDSSFRNILFVSSYWLGTAGNYGVRNTAVNYNKYLSGVFYNNSSSFGVRPVIVI